MKQDLLRTANIAACFALLRASQEAVYDPNGDPVHGQVTTANTSLFNQAHFSEPLHGYALGWRDPANYDQVSDFIAPPVPAAGDIFEHIEYPNAEAFLAEVNGDDDLRAIFAEFLTVEYTSTKQRRTIPNRGLRMVVDYDQVKTMPNWQTHYTDRLLQRVSRNAARRKVALALAAGVAVAKTWGSSADADLDIANERKTSGDLVGINPNRALIGEGANLLRFGSYGAQSNAAGFAGRTLSMEEALRKIGLQTLVDESRVQSGVSKVSLLGNKIVLFNAYGTSGEDPSNFKTARGTTQQGGRWGIYLRQIGVKFWEITVECYEMEWVASTLGVRTITVS